MLGLNIMISTYRRELILSQQEDLTYLSMTGSNLVDAALPELAALVEKNPFIRVIDLDFNPRLTKTSVTSLKLRLPGIEIINADCFKSLEQLMEQSTRTIKPPTLSLGSTHYFMHSRKADTTTAAGEAPTSDADQQNVNLAPSAL
jgi:hypothetical protein